MRDPPDRTGQEQVRQEPEGPRRSLRTNASIQALRCIDRLVMRRFFNVIRIVSASWAPSTGFAGARAVLSEAFLSAFVSVLLLASRDVFLVDLLSDLDLDLDFVCGLSAGPLSTDGAPTGLRGPSFVLPRRGRPRLSTAWCPSVCWLPAFPLQRGWVDRVSRALWTSPLMPFLMPSWTTSWPPSWTTSWTPFGAPSWTTSWKGEGFWKGFEKAFWTLSGTPSARTLATGNRRQTPRSSGAAALGGNTTGSFPIGSPR